MKEYRNDIGKVHVKLSREEQKKLYLKMQEGNEYARDTVIHSCLTSGGRYCIKVQNKQ